MTNTKNTILITDDDADNIAVIQQILGEEYNILTAENGQKALQLIETKIPDIVLLDWNMPVMNGLETLQKIKSDTRFRHIIVIMMTGYLTSQDNLLVAFKEGANDFLRKPFDEAELKARVKSMSELAAYYKLELNKKNNELLSMAIRLSEQNELVNHINNDLNQLVGLPENRVQKWLDIFKQRLNAEIIEKSLQEFEKYFTQTHPDFIKNLTLKHPGLTPGELKLCNFLRLNLRSKEIATILHLTPDSIKVARNRLRTKLSLDTNDNLTAYLMQF